MDSEFIKLILIFLVFVLPAILKGAEEKRKKRRAQERGEGRGSPRADLGGGSGRGPGGTGAGGKSLAEWIEELKKEAGAPAAGGGPRPATPAPEPEPEPVAHHQRHEPLKPSGKAPQETVKAHGETRHEFQQAQRPSVVIDEVDEPAPTRAKRGKVKVAREAPVRQVRETEGLVARVAPRYESEHTVEAPVEPDSKSRKAQRARRAGRAGRGEDGGSAGRAAFDLSPAAMRRAFILKEILDQPIAMRRPGRLES